MNPFLANTMRVNTGLTMRPDLLKVQTGKVLSPPTQANRFRVSRASLVGGRQVKEPGCLLPGLPRPTTRWSQELSRRKKAEVPGRLCTHCLRTEFLRRLKRKKKDVVGGEVSASVSTCREITSPPRLSPLGNWKVKGLHLMKILVGLHYHLWTSWRSHSDAGVMGTSPHRENV